MQNKQNYLLLLLVVIAVSVSIKLNAPPKIVSKEKSKTAFSAESAFEFVKEISKQPHSSGSDEHLRVRDFILSCCKKYGLETTIQRTTSVNYLDNTVKAANIQNIIARYKGKSDKHCLVVMAHYDTQPNTAGASDDGAGVAAMLETIKILKNNNAHFENDIIFLFTDDEEKGMLGAKAFIEDSVYRNQTAFVINFEARGNAGVSTMFEVNNQNGWAIQQYIKAVPFPNANSLNYEVYKIIPNNTDYTFFRQHGINGLNHAFIEGFAYYHNPADNPKNMDLRSLQHHGSNMLALVEHLANKNLEKTEGTDITYFNILGNLLVSYRASYNIYLIIACTFLFLFMLFISFKRQQLKVASVLLAFITFIITLGLMYSAGYLFIELLHKIYPLHARFYSYNTYNIFYYFFAITCLGIFIFAIIFQKISEKYSYQTIFTAIASFLLILLWLMYYFVPSGIYILCFPLTFLLIGNCLLILLNPLSIWSRSIILLASVTPSVLLLSPTIYLSFVAFGLSNQGTFVIIAIGILSGMLFPVLSGVLKNRNIVTRLAVLGFIISILVAHIQSNYTSEKPLLSSVWYEFDASQNKAYWKSDFIKTDFWSQQFFKKSIVQQTDYNKYPDAENKVFLISDAPLLPLSSISINVVKDSIKQENRILQLHIQPTRKIVGLNIVLDNTNLATSISINNIKNNTIGKYKVIDFLAVPENGFDVSLTVSSKKPFIISVTDRSIGLPKFNTFKDYPSNVVPGTDWNSNTTQVTKSFTL